MIPADIAAALRKAGLKAPTPERVDRQGYTPRELEAIRKHRTPHSDADGTDEDWAPHAPRRPRT